jgi:spore germination protein GerM
MIRRKHASTILVLALFGAGLWMRSLGPFPALWTKTTTVTLYFVDGPFLFPVSRRMPANDDLPRAVLQALLDGPRSETGLTNPIPHETQIRSFQVSGGVARIDLSKATVDEVASTAIIETMTKLPGVTSVALSAEGKPLSELATRVPLLYYASSNGLVGVPVNVTSARAALDAYLSGPSASELTGLPSDARLLGYDYTQAEGLLSLKFAYTSSVRTLALDKPDRMRLVLLGLIASLTEFPGVRAVQLDFGGQTRLGLGQCSDLLGAPQPRPELLNDERLL